MNHVRHVMFVRIAIPQGISVYKLPFGYTLLINNSHHQPNPYMGST